ncbi:Thymidylate kinase [uncultured Candidatus Thioglobus sp.]|nr:Thymidylate kinase [uncultured Candidatus Thioglobus sp.]
MAHPSQELFNAYIQKGENYQPRTRHIENGKAQFTNHLILSNSPYLLQHAHNPVNWYEFNDEAFELAKQQGKLIFLSIGYSTCHWCHVMEEESFESLAVAKVLNQDFVAIKVDREILPDVDAHFMNIAQLLTGSGGWPLNVVLTPDGEGFFAGTYFPKDNLIANLNNLTSLWQTDKPQIFQLAERIHANLRTKKNTASKLISNLQTQATANLLRGFDELSGGFGEAPKFPHEAQLLMLIDEQMRTPSENKFNAITTTLDAMAAGGIYDVVAGGFHRYSSDNAWLFPHFEKMLYNQAQLAMVYTKAYQLTGKNLYQRIATQTLDYVIREMQMGKDGGFYSATDADSEGEEGLFFIWNETELKAVLGNDFKVFTDYFDLSNYTEFEDKNVIHFKDVNTLKAQDFSKIDPLLKRLYDDRLKRIKPLLDDKILLSWNALLLKALVVAGEIDAKYLNKAQTLADFLIQAFYQNDLKRVQIEGNTSQMAIFEDYAYFADGLIALNDALADKKYLILAQKLMDTALTQFWDEQNFGFKISNNKRISTHNKEIYDGAILSPNGVAYGVLNQLFTRTGEDKYQQFAEQLLNAFSAQINQNPSAYGTIVNRYNAHQHGSIDNIQYAYNGKIRVAVAHGTISLDIAKGWHINANKTLQKSLIATHISSDNLKSVQYPQASMIKLANSQEELAIYSGNIKFQYQLKTAQFSFGELSLQACSNQVCLPPQILTLLLNHY